MDYYGETTRLFTHLVSANPTTANVKSDDKYEDEVDAIMREVKALSIVSS